MASRLDLRLGARRLWHAPATTLATVLTLVLATAACTAVFAVVDVLLLRPLPFTDGNALVAVWSSPTEGRNVSVKPAEARGWRTRSDVFTSSTTLMRHYLALSGEGSPERISGAVVSSTFFDTLGVHAALGSVFHGQPGGVSDRSVVVISDALWRRRYGSDPGVLGRTLTLDDRPYVVIGVLAPEMRLATLNPGQPASRDVFQVYLPAAHDDLPYLGPDPDADEQALAWSGYLRMIARLRPGISVAAATDALTRMNVEIYRDQPGGGAPSRASVLSLRDQLVGPTGPLLLLMLAATGLVLAIAMVNVTHLQLVRALSRSRELAVRTALGAERGALIAALVGESLLLGGVAGVLSIPASRLALRGMLALGPTTLPDAAAVPLSARVFAVALGASLLAAVGATLVPALRVVSTDPAEVLRTAAIRSHRVLARSVLLVLQVALALVLLIGAGLLVRSQRALDAVPYGCDPRGVLTWSLSLPSTRYPDAEADAAGYLRVLEKVRALPGVEAAGAVQTLPFSGDDIVFGALREDEADDPDARRPIGYQVLTPGYLEATRMTLLRGRGPELSDTRTGVQVVLLNDSAARRDFPGMDPLGRRLRVGSELRTVVGIVADVRKRGLDPEGTPTAYVPVTQHAFSAMAFAARNTRRWGDLAADVRRAVAEVDPQLPLAAVLPLEDVLDQSTRTSRFALALLGCFAGLALLLALVGLAGVTAYTTGQRTHEVGVRMALGADGRRTLQLLVGQGLVPVALGLGLGGAVALATSSVLGSLLFRTDVRDPWVFAVSGGALALAAVLAILVPAVRAVFVDPAQALRSE